MPQPHLSPQLATLTDSVQVYTQFGSGVVRHFNLLQLKSYILAGATNYSGLNSVTFNSSTGEISIDDGVNAAWVFTVPDVDPSNETQTLVIDPATGLWAISGGGGAGDLNDGISWNSGTNTLSLFGTAMVLNDAGTDNQVLSISGTNLELTSDDGTDVIDLLPYISAVFNVADEAGRNAITGQSVGSVAIVADADGTGNNGVSWWTGYIWTPIITFQDKAVVNQIALTADLVAIADPQRGDVALIADAGGGAGISFHNGSTWTTPILFGGGNAPNTELVPNLNIDSVISADVQDALTKLNDNWINHHKLVTKFGVLVYDDNTAAAANKAIIELALVGGGLIKFPENKIIYVDQINVPESNTFIDLNTSTLRLEDNSTATQSVLDINKDTALAQMENVWVFNGTIDGNKANQTVTGEMEGIDVYNCRNLRLYNLTIKDCVSDGLDADATTGDNNRLQIIGCSFIDNDGMGAHLYDCDNGIVANCIFTGNVANPVGAIPQAALDVNSNTVLTNIAENVLVTSNTFNNNACGIILQAGTSATVSNNSIYNCIDAGLLNGYGILSSDTRSVIKNNVINTTTRDGINGQLGVTDSNYISNTGGHGINSNTSFAADGVISDNVIYNAGNHGIRIAAQDVKLSNNVIELTTNNGIDILASVTPNYIINGGSINNAGVHGFHSVTTVSITDLQVHNSGTHGIFLEGVNTNDSLILNCVANNNGSLGINISGDDCTISTTAVENNNWGISAADGVNVLSCVVKNNTTFGANFGSAVLTGSLANSVFEDNGTNLEFNAANRMSLQGVKVGGVYWNRGAEFQAVRSVTADYTIDDLDQYLNVDATGGNINITIGSLFSGFNANAFIGRKLEIRRIDSTANTVTILGAINGGTNYSVPTDSMSLLQITSTSRIDVSTLGAFNGGTLTAQTLVEFVAKNFTSTGITTVFHWIFKDNTTGEFIDLPITAVNAQNTEIQVTSDSNYSDITIYYYGLK
jgi:parallel beta-helix repeat protein